MTILGTDVSAYQSAAYPTAGTSFVFIKATEGTSYVNPRQAAQTAHGRAAGLVVGFYHFLHPGDPVGQASYFVSKCASQPGDILACDWEPTSAGLASNADKDAFIKEVKRLRPGHRVILYCDVARWTGVDKTSYCGDGLWIADPNHPAGSPGIKAAWLFQQYSSANGIDHNIGNFASEAALVAWAKNTTPSSGGTAVTATAYTDVMKTAQIPVVISHDSDGAWSAETVLSYIVRKLDALGTELDALKLQSETNGGGISALKLQIDTLSGVVKAKA
jgi:hypothetical protein